MTFSWFRIMADKFEILVVALVENPLSRPLSLRERGVRPEHPCDLKYE
jgi:hypothetical protein